MRHALLVSFALVLFAGVAWAGPGSVGIFGDPAGTKCNLPDSGPQTTMYYVVHVNTTGAMAVAYTASKPTCSTATWLADNNVFTVTIGNSQTGVAMGYGTCLVGSFHVQTIVYFTDGLTPNCCKYPVLKHPGEGRIAAVDCNQNYWIPDPTGGVGIIRPLPHCNCDVPAEDTTWGRVKSLYSE